MEPTLLTLWNTRCHWRVLWVMLLILPVLWHGGKTVLQTRDQWPQAALYVPVQVKGVVTGLPMAAPDRTRFVLRVTAIYPESQKPDSAFRHSCASRNPDLMRSAHCTHSVLPGFPILTETKFASELSFHKFGNDEPERISAPFFPGHQWESAAIQLSWYGEDHPLIAPGQTWQFTVKLKPPHGLHNPGGMDFAKYLERKGIVATGYVYGGQQQLLSTDAGVDWLSQLRARLRSQFLRATSGFAGQGVLLALALGDQSRITQQQWEVFRRVGINHLIAISGLHIGLIAAAFWFAVRWTWALWPWLTRRCPAQTAAWGAALLSAIVYSALAGFSVPTQRAMMMIACFALAQLSRRLVSPYVSWLLALLLVLAWNPWNAVDASTWLSFGAVALLIYCFAGRLRLGSHWLHWLRPQWPMSVGLLPLTAFWFGEVSLISWVANMIAIPWLGIGVTGLVVLGVTVLPVSFALAHGLLWLANGLWLGIWWMLQAMAYWPMASLLVPPISIPLLLLAMIGCVWILAPRGVPARYVGWLLLLPLFFASHAKPEPGAVWMTVLDVGQGLAVVVQTQAHTLVYDAGPAAPEGINTGSEVVVPYLIRQGVRTVDRLVISHGDSDHSGGAGAVLAGVRVRELDTSAPELFKGQAPHPCTPDRPWQWDGVEFEYLEHTEGHSANNRSCVLRIQVGATVILLPGDIERPGERALLQQDSQRLRATILVAPHHGSATSSSAAFVQAVHPRYVVFATGFHNQYGLPKASVVARYRALGARVFDTGTRGAVVFKVAQDDSVLVSTVVPANAVSKPIGHTLSQH